jgi:hypothetical protein
MSKEFKTIKKSGKNDVDLEFTSFFGGEKGTMLQVSQGLGTKISLDEPGFIQLTKRDVYGTIRALTQWLQDQSEKETRSLEEKIKKDKDLRKTLVQDALDCERFIRNLETLNIPLRLLFGASIEGQDD